DFARIEVPRAKAEIALVDAQEEHLRQHIKDRWAAPREAYEGPFSDVPGVKGAVDMVGRAGDAVRAYDELDSDMYSAKWEAEDAWDEKHPGVSEYMERTDAFEKGFKRDIVDKSLHKKDTSLSPATHTVEALITDVLSKNRGFAV